MTKPATDTLEREKDKLWIKDSELKIIFVRCTASTAVCEMVALANKIVGVE